MLKMFILSLLKGQFARFLLIGGINFLINFITYVLLVFWGFHYLAASGVAWLLGVINSYYLNRKITFSSNAPIVGELTRHLIVYIMQLLIAWILLIILIEFAGFDYITSYLMNIIFVTIVSFIGLKYFAFRNVSK